MVQKFGVKLFVQHFKRINFFKIITISFLLSFCTLCEFKDQFKNIFHSSSFIYVFFPWAFIHLTNPQT